jgi:hypothetical protein
MEAVAREVAVGSGQETGAETTHGAAGNPLYTGGYVAST